MPDYKTAVKKAVGLMLFLGMTWAIIARESVIAPLSLLGLLGILGFGAWRGGATLSLGLEEHEDATGTKVYGGPYFRTMIVDALLGFAILVTVVALVPDKGSMPEATFGGTMAGIAIFVIPFSVAGLLECAGRRRDWPRLAAASDAASGAVFGGFVGGLAYLFKVGGPDHVSDKTALLIWALAGAAAGAVLNMIRRAGQQRSHDAGQSQ